METMDTYLRRKHEELRLLDACLDRPLASPPPQSIDEVIALKFKLTAAIRAQHDLKDWTTTETAWSHRRKSSDSPFEFRYDYQRADLNVAGPSFYDLGDDISCETIYTSSGMASISGLMLALSHVFLRADMVVLPGTYGETLEFIQGYARYLNVIPPGGAVLGKPAPNAPHRILLLESCALAKDFEACLRSSWSQFDLCIFDTTCFYGGSSRVRRALQKAGRDGVPVVMVRSHTKLDSLGAEYGRLGSTTFVRCRKKDTWCSSRLGKLAEEMRKAVRLLGGAALPAHFPPYVGNTAYRSLSAKRVAAMLRNGRRTARHFRKVLGNLTAELDFVHGLYFTLTCRRPLDERGARQAASKMSDDIGRAGFPMRHAGSFGFDFAAIEWCHDVHTGGFAVRIAVPDLPTAIWDAQSSAIAMWWIEHDRALGPR
ncbi:hypothetical protein FXB40_42775 [Bradyrhizobium rifense]|uniref:PLP-dependent transferase n=2 Tax=Bradyrhizobium rifense TaxID=515499 RepID=A0A5D3K2F4_9BRAD|nr:hypothetical protein [Bradyrhizobium rifense]TYL85610.1 hypothetical protein FXB40_42775 [Bradyrhizobium rifense]